VIEFLDTGHLEEYGCRGRTGRGCDLMSLGMRVLRALRVMRSAGEAVSLRRGVCASRCRACLVWGRRWGIEICMRLERAGGCVFVFGCVACSMPLVAESTNVDDLADVSSGRVGV